MLEGCIVVKLRDRLMFLAVSCFNWLFNLFKNKLNLNSFEGSLDLLLFRLSGMYRDFFWFIFSSSINCKDLSCIESCH